MSCLSNTVIKNPITGEKMPVSCGKCLPCRMKRAVDWRVRIAMERYTQKDFGSSFATLTYCDEAIGVDYSCHISDLQKCIKRIRYYVKKHNKYISPTFKYFGVSEYGDISARKHFHLIVLGINSNTLGKILRESWKFGFVSTSPLSPYRIRYVVDYCTIYDPTDEVKDEYRLNGLEPPQDIFSNGIGADYMVKYRDEAERDGFYFFNGKKWIPPAYWRKKLRLSIDSFSALKQRIGLLKDYGYKLDEGYIDSNNFDFVQADITNRANRALNKKTFKDMKPLRKISESDVSYLVDEIKF